MLKGQQLAMENYYQKEIETASHEQIRAWQDERLVKTVHRVWEQQRVLQKTYGGERRDA